MPIYTPREVADWFIARVEPDTGDVMTHLKLQKLVYYAQAWSLALNDQPLFKENVQAWTHGPVVPSLFREYRNRGFEPIVSPAGQVRVFDEDANHVLEEVWNVYGPYSAKYLEDLTHREDPWIETRGELPLEAHCKKPISQHLMKSYYRSLLNQRIV